MGKLVAIKTYEEFGKLLLRDAIDNYALNYILDTKLLYTHGIFINGATFGTKTSDSILLTIAGSQESLALTSHTHSNYLEKDADIDIGNYKIKSGQKDLMYVSDNKLYIGGAPVYINDSTFKIVKNQTTYDILDTGNFSIEAKTLSGTTLQNVATFKYGGNNFSISYVRRINTTESFDNLISCTLAGTTKVNNIQYGFLTLYTDNTFNNPGWALLRFDIDNGTMQYRTSANSNNWISLNIPSLPVNALNTAGIVTAPTSSDGNKVWKTDSEGNPGWRSEQSYTFNDLKFLLIENTDLMTYNTQTTKIIRAGDNIAFSYSEGVLTLRAADTTYSLATDSTPGLVKVGTTLESDSSYTKVHIKDGFIYYHDTTYSFSDLKFLLTSGTDLFTYNSQSAKTILAGDNITFQLDSNNNLVIKSKVYSDFSGSGTNHKNGLVPDPGATQGTTKFLREDGTWEVPTYTQLPTFYNIIFNNGTDDVFTYDPDGSTSKTIVKGSNINFAVSGNTLTISAIDTWKPVNTTLSGYVPNIVTNGSLSADDNPFILVYKNINNNITPVWVPLPANAFNNTTYTFYDLVFNDGTNNVDTYKPTTSPSKTIKAGSNVTISAASDVITISSKDTWTAADFDHAGYVPKSVKGMFLHANATTGALEWVEDRYSANTDKTGIKLGTVNGTKKTDSTVIKTDSSTGLLIEGGTNLFKIGDGTNYIEIGVTPSITNNVTGSGTSGKLAKWNGTNTITDGPTLSAAITSLTQSTKFLREDGTWATPSYTTDKTGVKKGTAGSTTTTDGTVISVNSSSGIIFEGGTNQFKVGNGTNSITIGVSHGLSTKNININGTDYAVYTSANSLPTIKAPTAFGTAGQVLATNSNANGLVWVNANAHSHSYLPLAGGTMNSGVMISWQDWGLWGASNPTYPKANGGLQWNGTSDYIKLFAEETGSDDLRLILQFGDDDSPRLEIRNASGTANAYIKGTGAADFTALSVSGTNVSLNGHKHPYTDLTGSSTTANQAIVSNGTANGWTLKTLGSRAFDSTSYLPLTGGTLNYDTPAPLGLVGNTNYSAISFRCRDNTSASWFGFKKNGAAFVTSIGWSAEYDVLHTGNSSVSLSGSTLTVNIGGTSKSLTNTWRGILNNLTSDSTTESLSAALGKALAGGSARDNTKLPLSGGTMNDRAVIARSCASVGWYQGRLYPIIKTTSYTGYNSILSMKTTNGSWDLGVYSSDTAYLTYITDANYNAGSNTTTYQLTFPKATGTIALTSLIPTKSSWNYDDRYLKLAGGMMDNTAGIYWNNTNRNTSNAWNIYTSGHGLEILNAANSSVDVSGPPQLRYGVALHVSGSYWLLLCLNRQTESFWIRGGNTDGVTTGGWKELAYITSNVASATKLQTTRNIWGQSFDGTANVSGALSSVNSIYLNNNTAIYFKNTNGADLNILQLSSGNGLYLGYSSSANGSPTYIYGNEIRLLYGTSRTAGVILNSSGNVGIGTNSPAQKLHVNGSILSGDISGKDTGNILTFRHLDGQKFSNSDYNLYLQYNLPSYKTFFNGSTYYILGGQYNGNAASATQLANSRNIWGQSFNGAGNVSGSLSNVSSIEFSGVGSSSGHGGFIDFHYNGSTSDYTSRIIEWSSGVLDVAGINLRVNGYPVFHSTHALTTNGEDIPSDKGIGIVACNNKLPANLVSDFASGNANYNTPTGITPYNYGQVLNFFYDPNNAHFLLYVSDVSSNIDTNGKNTGIFYRSGYGSTRRPWRLILDNASILTYYGIKFNLTSTASKIQMGFPKSTSFVDTLSYQGTSAGNADLYVGDPSHDTRINGRNVYLCVDGNYVVYVKYSVKRVGINTTDPASALEVNGDCRATNFVGASDVRLKDIISYKVPDLDTIAAAPGFLFRWKDPEKRAKIYAGTSALYWQEVFPNVVHKADNSMGTLAIQYDVLGTLCSISLAREVKMLKELVQELKEYINNHLQ